MLLLKRLRLCQGLCLRSGVNKGRISASTKRYALHPEGDYSYPIQASPEMSWADGGATATATAVLEYEVSDIIIAVPGTTSGRKPIAACYVFHR
jgi:hypothetical protein